MKHGILFRTLIFFCFLFLTLGSRTALGQEALELFTTPRDTIPKEHYKSWSLFLISNPEWILPESEEKIRELYYRFKAFGDAIGPDHLAVWFWTQRPTGDFFKYVDVMRSSAFCSKLNLPPSKSPYLIITSEYPGAGTLSRYPESFFELKNVSVVELSELDASEITTVLASLADRILIEGLDGTDADSEDFWRGWQRSFESIRDNLVGLSKKVKLTINTTFFKVEIDPSHED